MKAVHVSQSKTSNRIYYLMQTVDRRTGLPFGIPPAYSGGPVAQPNPFEVRMYGVGRPVERVTVRTECLLYSGDDESMHAFARKIGLPKGFWSPEAHAYVLSNRMRKKAIRAGATYRKIETPDGTVDRLEVATTS